MDGGAVGVNNALEEARVPCATLGARGGIDTRLPHRRGSCWAGRFWGGGGREELGHSSLLLSYAAPQTFSNFKQTMNNY